MRINDLTVEVRDRDLTRVGQIVPAYLDLQAKDRWCGVGEWTLTLPGDHSMVPHLIEPGSGIIILGPEEGGATGTLMSGPTTTPQRVRNRQNPDGTYTFQGVSDEILLLGALAFPDPTKGDPQASSQSRSNDTRTGSAEDLMRQFVAFNVTYDQAPAARVRGLRRFLDLSGSSLSRGATITKSPRFQNLLELLQEIVLLEPSLGFRVVQVGPLLEFQVLSARDKRATVRFDIENGTVTSEEIASSGPSLTQAIVAGQGEGAERTIITRTTADAVTAEAEWGIPYERFIDQRDTDDLVELQQSGDEALEDARGGTSVKMVPSDDTTMLYGVDWRLGDLVTMVVDGSETTTRVTESILLANASAVMVGAGIGDLSGFTKQDAQGSQVEALDVRVSRLERSGGLAERLAPQGREIDNWDLATEVGFYWAAAGAAFAPFAGASMGRVERDQNRIIQEVLDPSFEGVWRRVYSSGAWGAWKAIGPGVGLPFRQAAGSVSVAQNVTGSGTIAFPTGRFNVPPIVTLTLRSYKANTQIFAPSVTASGFEWGTYLINAGSNTGGVAFDWVATQMASAAAAG